MTIYQNITENAEEKTYERLFCSQEITAGIRGYLIFISAFNVLLAICSSLGNILILIALHKETTLHAPSKLFLRSLAITDQLVITDQLAITGVSSVIWLQVAVAVCYLPHGIITALWTYSGQSSAIIVLRQLTLTLVYFNSTLNPLLYCWKISEVRQLVKELLRRSFCC